MSLTSYRAAPPRDKAVARLDRKEGNGKQRPRGARRSLHPNSVLRRHPRGRQARRVRAVCTNDDALWKGSWRGFFQFCDKAKWGEIAAQGGEVRDPRLPHP